MSDNWYHSNKIFSKYLNSQIRQLRGRALLNSPDGRLENTMFEQDEFPHHHPDLWQLVISLLLVFQLILIKKVKVHNVEFNKWSYFYLNDQNERQCRGQPLLGTFNSFIEWVMIFSAPSRAISVTDFCHQYTLITPTIKRAFATFSTLDKEFVNLRTSPFMAWLRMFAQPFQISSRIVSPGPTSWYL